ncbi:MAG: hypothetical protein U0797_22255 [Gemmataceae bacterium]
MSTVASPQQPAAGAPASSDHLRQVVISHSPIVYWWPVWAVGYVLAVLTYLQGVSTPFKDVEVLVHPSPALGVVFTATFLLVIVITHLTVRGTASITVIFALVALALFLAYMDWWDDIFRVMGRLAIFMNLGFYVFFSTAVFAVWVLAVFVFDHMEYWEFRPGQVIRHSMLGGGQATYDARGMAVDKKRDDLFRHWILGLGSGDLRIATTGAKKADFVVPNVMFIDSKLPRIQQLAAMQPDDDPVLAPPPAQAV